MGPCRSLFFGILIQFFKYSLELLSCLLILLHLGLVNDVNVPLDANKETLSLILFIVCDSSKIKEATRYLVLFEFRVGSAKGTIEEDRLSNSKLLSLIYQLAISEDRLLLMSFYEKLKDVLEHLRYGIF